MSNLGSYEEFTTAVKVAGGVDPYLRQMKQAAALKGASATVVVLGTVLLISDEVKRRRAVRKLHEITAEENSK